MKYRVGSNEFYAIELLETGKAIGNIYSGNRNYDAGEVGYIVNKLYQGKGYTSEALFWLEWIARSFFAGLLIINGSIFWKRILPVYKESFSNEPGI